MSPTLMTGYAEGIMKVRPTTAAATLSPIKLKQEWLTIVIAFQKLVCETPEHGTYSGIRWNV
jgi:hypothetical protein